MQIQTEQPKNGADEHILVCLSSSPSNARIIHTAAKMAKVLHAKFTAIYVQTDSVESEKNRLRLEQNIQLAQGLGAEIIMTHGEDVPLQISEYVRLSDVTKIVIGQSSARRRGLFGKPTLTEKLISVAPNVDIHIIPDALNYVRPHRHRLLFGAETPSLRDIGVTVLSLAVCTAIGFLFDHLDFPDTNIVTVYILGVLMVSVLTKGYLCSMAGSLLSVVLFGFFLTEPQLSFKTYAVGYPVTFAVMLVASVLTGTLASKLKDHARLSARSAFRTQVLFDTDRLLQKAKSNDDILSVTCMQLSRLLDRSIVAYTKSENGMSTGRLFAEKKYTYSENLLNAAEQKAAEWAFQNGRRTGATTAQFGQSECLYLAIRAGGRVYGVIGIPMKPEKPDSFESSIVLSVVNECALAMDNAHNAAEKERAADLAKSEQLRADLLRSISHDLRTPLCSVSGNADTLLHNGNCLDEATKQQIYKDIYDDSEWLIGVVENLLYVTRLNDGRLKLELTNQLVDEVISEAVSHLKQKSVGHTVTVKCDDLILARMDAQLIVQVIVNLIDNALKYTEQGSEICVSAEKQGKYAVIRVADNGSGIPDDMKSHIFEMFYTGKSTVADSRRSFGIGLTLCKSIVELHGGTLTLRDNVPCGCVFTFTLPLSEVTLNE